MMPFDNRTTSSPPLQRPLMAPYLVTGSYNPSPLNSIASPHYQAPNPYPFGTYHGPPTPPHQSPHFKPDYHDRRVMGTETDNTNRTLPFPRDMKHPYGEQAPSPARSESQASIARSISNPNLNSKTITSNATVHPSLQVNFETEVDELMKAIQQKEEGKPANDTTVQPPLTPSSEVCSEHSTPAPVDGKIPHRKRYSCDGPSCKKTFSQKTHLEIHRRTHTGDKPYVSSPVSPQDA